MKAKITIVFKSFNKTFPSIGSVKQDGDEVTSLLSAEEKCIRSVRLPKKRILYTVLRSPHIDKKSREQFEMKIHKKCFVINTETKRIRSALLPLMLNNSAGTQCKIVVNYKTVYKNESK